MIVPDGKPIPHEAQAAFPLMVKYLLPPGLRGIVVAGLLSALMGSLAGVFNACSTLFTVDLYEKWKPEATQHQIVRTGRIATAVMVLIALAWIPVIKGAHGPVRLPAGGARLPGAADLRGLLLRRVLQTAQRQGLLLGHGGGLPPGHLPHVGRYAGHAWSLAGLRERLRAGLVPVDRQQHLLPVLQRADHPRLGGGDGRGELPDAGRPTTRRSRASPSARPRRKTAAAPAQAGTGATCWPRPSSWPASSGRTCISAGRRGRA